MNKPVQLADSTKARFTTAEFLRMLDSGAFDDMTIELIDGELERMNPPMSGHGAQQAQITALLWHACAGTALQVFGEVGIDLGDDTVLACDAAIARASIDTNRLLTATDLLLVVEVAETTRARDLNRKRTRYAVAGIPDYWVIDGASAVVHVHREPVDGGYALIETVCFGEPLAVPGTDAVITLA